MITNLGGKLEVLTIREFEFKKDPDIPARNFLPEDETSNPPEDQVRNNQLNLKDNQKLVAWADIWKQEFMRNL